LVLALTLALIAKFAGNQLGRLIRARPEIFLMAKGSFIAKNWDAPTRFARIIDHCKTVATIGGVVDFPPDKIVYLMQFPLAESRYHITIDQPRYLLSEGLANINLMEGTSVLFCLTFCLSSYEGKLIAYIGGLKGKPDALEHYRHLKNATAGMRPRDVIIKVFKTFCAAIGVVELRAVSDDNCSCTVKKLSYDQVWRERGGVYDGKGFFVLPIISERRSEKEVPAKRRTMHRKRYAIFDAIERILACALN
jgi:uncharacterized protein VirK/YbjX